MIVPDVNLLIYAYDTTCPDHAKSKVWLEDVLSGDELVGLPWQTISAFIRIQTDPRIPGDRFTMEEAARLANQWITLPNLQLLIPGERHWMHFRRMLIDGQVRGPLTSDAALAALTVEYGGILYTNDRDFARFPGLRWTNPLLET